MIKEEIRQQKINKNIELRCTNPDYNKLMDEALGYEHRYFKDMTCNNKSIKDLFKVEYFNEDGTSKGKGDYGDLPYITISDWIIKEKQIKSQGICYNKQLEIIIKKDLPKLERKSAFLHEMIHAYEYDLGYSVVGKKIKEIILISLHKEIEKQLGKRKLNKVLGTITNVLFWDDNFHSLLFALKSFDLDIRLNQPFGFVYGYGKIDFFK